jgi:UDP-N-acetylglucosamine transferase subunit ALG13
MEAGKCPVLVPRMARHGEHVDDHQRQVAEELEGRGLAVHRPAEALTLADLKRAMSVTISESPDPPTIRTGLAGRVGVPWVSV